VILYLDRRFFDRLMSDTVLEANKEVKTAALLTGPEGGFENYEAELAAMMGLRICSMGPRIFRCETAPVAALAAVMYATGNM
jgi:16S rRNA (uracil1498-N3)-methyltransferase